MDKIWAKDVKEGEKVKTILLVSRKAILTAKSGKTYLAVTFQDKTGELEGRAFDKIEELAALFEEKDAVEVEGLVGVFQGSPQLRLEAIAKVDAATLDVADFTWVAPPEPKKPEKVEKAEKAGPGDDALWTELLALVEAVADHHVKTLIKAFLEDDDFAGRLRRGAAAKTVHHAYLGGLLEHTVSCLKLAHRIADQYPQVDRDLLVAGAFFHDIGKVRELSIEKSAEYTDEGRLVGHVVMAAQWIHDKARRTGVPRELEHQIVHVVLAHHGKMEFGSPRPPMTLEAMIVHYIDDLDSRVNSWLNLMGREGGNRRWTSADNVYEQPIWRGALPTTQAEKKGPAPEVLSPVIYVPREGSRQSRPEQSRKERQKAKPPRPPQEHRPAGEPKAADAAGPAGADAKAEAKPEGAPQRAERPPRADRPPDRGGFRGGPGGGHGGPGGAGGFGDKKRGYMGPRQPGDRGPQARPAEKKLTHNPFAALAAKLGGEKAEEAPAAAEAAPAVEQAPEPAVEPTAPVTPPAEGGAGENPTA